MPARYMIACGVMGLLLSPVLFLLIAQASNEPQTNMTDDSVQLAILCALGPLLIGWMLVEAGLHRSGARLGTQILSRVPLYFFLVLMLLFFALMGMLSLIRF